MYTQVIENELTLQKLAEEKEALLKRLAQIEAEEKKKEKTENDRYGEKIEELTENFKRINIDDKNKKEKESSSGYQTEFKSDLDIFKKLQEQMNKKSKVLENTLNKYKMSSSVPTKTENKTEINEIKENNPEENEEKIPIDIPDEELENNFTFKYTDYAKFNKNKKDTSNIEITSNDYEPYIYKIPSILLDNKIEEISLYIRLEMLYGKIKNVTQKLNFISILRQVLTNIIMIKRTNFSVFLQLINFILSIQTKELLDNVDKESLPSIHIQDLLNYLLTNKDLTEVIRILLVLMKQYFPQNMESILENKNIIILKLLLFNFKKMIESAKYSFLVVSDILTEINDFLFSYPPSQLKKSLPLFELFFNIFDSIKKLCLYIIKNKTVQKDDIIDALSKIKGKNSTVSKDFITFIEYYLSK